MVRIKEVKVNPLEEKFGIQHRLVLSEETPSEVLENLINSFQRFSSAQDFQAEGKNINLSFDGKKTFTFELEKDIEDYYTDEVHEAWKRMVSDAMGTEEPFRYYSFYTPDGEHIGTVGFKQDCENFYPVIVIYKNF
jgi:hypothetical protein